MQGVHFSCSKRCIRDFAVITWKGGWDTRWRQRENHNLAQREVACTIGVIGGAQASFELFERTVELSCGK